MVEGTSTAVVSTLHKVKGLEFDNVVILPSAIPFGVGGRDRIGPDLAGDAAEEARLLYVGMTRAKKKLRYYRGDREQSWDGNEPMPHEGLRAQGQVLVGSMEDVALGWAMQKSPFNPSPDDCQRYVESEVAVEPNQARWPWWRCLQVLLAQWGLWSTGASEFLAMKHVVGGPNAELKVSAIVRFRPNQVDETFADCVREQGWGYAVLVSGRLR